MPRRIRTKEELLTRASIDKFLVGDTKDLHDARELFLLIFTGEDREAGIELRQNAA